LRFKDSQNKTNQTIGKKRIKGDSINSTGESSMICFGSSMTGFVPQLNVATAPDRRND
jgi:hypothetical protein